VVKLGADEIAAALLRIEGGVVEVANLNAPGQTVISGSAQAVVDASSALKALGGRVIPLKVSAPFHCSLMAPAAQRLARDLADVRFARPDCGIVCHLPAELPPGEGAAAAPLTEQVTAPVRWVGCVGRLASLGATRFLEVGAGQVLTGLVGPSLHD